MSTKIRPVGAKVLIKRDESKDKSEGGIFIPEQAQEKSQRGEVLAVGSGYRNEHGNFIVADVKPGDVVLFNKYGGAEVVVDGERLMLIHPDEIIGVIEP
jgi:chaperonin GroES